MARRIVRTGSRSLKTWIGQDLPSFGSDVSAGTGAFSPGLKSFGSPSDEDVTILRTRGNLAVTTGSVTPGNDCLQIALGIGLCTTEAALAGAVPLPFENPEWDGWFVYQVTPLQITTINSNLTTAVIAGKMEIDSKAMRKIPAGQVLFLSTQIFTGIGAGGDVFNQNIQARILLKTS